MTTCMLNPTLRASLSGIFLQRKDVVNHCLEFGYTHVCSTGNTTDLFELKAEQVTPSHIPLCRCGIPNVQFTMATRST